MSVEKENNEMWRRIFTGEMRNLRFRRAMMQLMPSDVCCTLCVVPFRGPAAPLMRLMGKHPSNKNPNICNSCDRMARTHPGAADIELSILFADVRGSTTLAERMSPSEYRGLLNRYYEAANRVLVHKDAIIDKYVGDEVMALFVPGLAGPHHAQKVLEAAEQLLQVTRHKDTSGPWIPLGIGVHTGIASVGSVGSTESFTDFTANGDTVNIAARLVGRAAVGQILTTEETLMAAGRDMTFLNRQLLELKGRSQPVTVYTIPVRD